MVKADLGFEGPGFNSPLCHSLHFNPHYIFVSACTMERAQRTLSELSFKGRPEPSLVLVFGGTPRSAKSFDEL